MQPKVSVIVPTRNRLELTAAALRSIAKQSYSNFEVIVVDDGSDDGVFSQYKDVMKEFDDRFEVFSSSAPGVSCGGPGATRNKGIALASGVYVAFLDSDDEWIAPDHLEVAVKSMASCGADYYFAEMQGQRNGTVVMPKWFVFAPDLASGEIVYGDPRVSAVPLPLFKSVMKHHVTSMNTVVIRRELLSLLGGFTEISPFGEDYHLMMRAADLGASMLFRHDSVARCRLPHTADSISMQHRSADGDLKALLCFQHLRLVCSSSLVRRCARSNEGWLLRRLSHRMFENGCREEAKLFARQSFFTYPAFGSAWLWMKRALF